MFRKIVSAVFILAAAAGPLAAGGSNETGSAGREGKVTVVTTLFPLYDFARQIAGDRADIALLLPPGIEPHAWEPAPRDIVRINRANIFIYTGPAMEPWTQRVITGTASPTHVVVNASKGIDLTGEDQDHAHGVSGASWAGAYELKNGGIRIRLGKGPVKDLQIAVLGAKGSGKTAIEELEPVLEDLFEKKPVDVRQGGTVRADGRLYSLKVDDGGEFELATSGSGTYVLFANHPLDEFGGAVVSAGITVSASAVEYMGNEETERDNGTGDPHIWTDPVLAVAMVKTIADGFVKADPEGAELYRSNAAAYIGQLEAFHAKAEAAFRNARVRTVIFGGHNALGYFARRYGLEFVSAYAGFSPDAEPSPRRIAELIANLRATGSKTVFYEELIEPRVARAIAEGTGAKLELLHGAHNVSANDLKTGITYLSIMEENLRKLKQSLGAE